jgi:hypothetical protein
MIPSMNRQSSAIATKIIAIMFNPFALLTLRMKLTKRPITLTAHSKGSASFIGQSAFTYKPTMYNTIAEIIQPAQI